MNFDAFLDTYIRPDDGTKIVLCSHTKCAKASALLFVALALRHSIPDVVQFVVDGENETKQVARALEWARSNPQTRRTVAIVVEPEGPSFTSILEMNSKPMSVYRITAASILGTTQ